MDVTRQLLALSSTAQRRRSAEADEQRARGRLDAALAQLAELARRRRMLEDRLAAESHPAVGVALFRQLDALEPLIDAAEDLVSWLAGEHSVSLSRLYASGGRR